MYIVYMREKVLFSLVCTFKKVVKSFKLKVDVQKGPLRFRGKLTLDVLFSSKFTLFHPNDVCFRVILL